MCSVRGKCYTFWHNFAFGFNKAPITPIRWTLATSSTLTVAGTLNNLNGEIDGTAVRFDNYGTLNVKEGGIINNYDYFFNHKTINNAGAINVDFSGIINYGTIVNKGTINLKNGGAIYLGSSGDPTFPDLPGKMINAGKVNIDSSSGFALTNSKSVLTNTGTIDNSNVLRIKSGTLNNSGEINNKSGVKSKIALLLTI